MKRTAALLSFFLPGLGQLSQKRIPWAIGFFTLFAVATVLERYWWIVPFVAVCAGLETLRVPPREAIVDKKLRTAYGLVGGIGFLAWFGYVSAFFLPVRSQMAVNEHVEVIRGFFSKCHSPQLEETEVVGCVRASPAGALQDPWGTGYEFGMKDGEFVVRSAGPDRAAGSDDDLVYRKPVRGAR